MKNIRTIIAALFILILATPAWAQSGIGEPPAFFETIPDMPLMLGLEEMVAQTSVFDKPQGRIIEAVVKMNARSRQEILAYYSKILPQLGWKEHESYKNFIRDNEVFTLQFSEDTAGNPEKTVIFYIAPKD